ncbi:MAG: cell division protein FtsQ/DivIB [Microcoleaceae cyanobacterium]
MAQINPVSQQDLGQRRRQLRGQRRWKSAQVFWRGIAVSSLVATGFWLTVRPVWLIQQPEQIWIQGNQLLSDERIRALLPITYPQSLWQIQPRRLMGILETQGQIAQARVTRQMFPPHLLIEVEERRPVAIAQPAQGEGFSQQLSQQPPSNDSVTQSGWLDAQGGLIPLESYAKLEQSGQLPSLKVIGAYQHYQQSWSEVYEVVSRSPVEIYEIDWQDPTNLVLTTELGIFHLGPYDPKFPEQIRTLDRLRNLPEEIDIDQVEYVDLYNPAIPSVQLLQEREQITPTD